MKVVKNNLNFENSYIKKKETQNEIEQVFEKVKIIYNDKMITKNVSYFDYIVKIVDILISIQVEPSLLKAGLLLKVKEVTNQEISDLEITNDIEVLQILKGNESVEQIPRVSEADYLEKIHRQMFIVFAKDIRVILLKLAERLQYLVTFKHEQDTKIKNVALETIKIYAPIAHRLGLYDLKSSLEDGALYYLDQNEYFNIASKLEMKKTERNQLVEDMLFELRELLGRLEIANLKAFGRSKHIYSIYKKISSEHKEWNEIYDFHALRIICNTKIECYTILGLIHEKYTPISNRFKDYIAVPKPNMYQSLHTTIVGVSGQIFEIQIRTHEMDDLCERGVAAHWLYKENNEKTAKEAVEEQLHWFRDLLRNSEENEYIETIKQDIFEANIFTLTPKGKVIHLPKDATVIDFAYRVHTEVAERMVGAKVNGAIVPYSRTLNTGDVVEILTKKNASGPNESWYDLIKTSHGRQKLRTYLKRKDRSSYDTEIQKSKEMLLEVIKERNLSNHLIDDQRRLLTISKELGLEDVIELYNSIANHKISASEVISMLEKEPVKERKINTKATAHKSTEPIIVDGASGITKRLANCCSPVYGDEIVAVISSGRALKIHQIDCPNIKIIEQSQKINAQWNEEYQGTATYNVDLIIYSSDRNFLLGDIATTLSQLNIGINQVDSRTNVREVVTKLTLVVKSKDQLEKAISNLKKIRSVGEVQRKIK